MPLFSNRGRELPEAILPIQKAKEAKIAMQQRIADSLSTKDNKLKNSDVLLYPTGMSDISHIHDIISLYTTARKRTVAIFGKIHGYECKLYDATHSDLETLEEDLASGLQLWALFTEFPGNPLLGSVDLERIERIYDEYDFLFVVDDTVGTSVNVDVISHCDIVCTGLTKMFSGRCNAMGGSVALKPNGGAPQTDFEERVIKASQNAQHIADILRKHSSVGQVYYPKGSPTQQLHEKYKRPGKGYGYLLSIRFKTPAAAIAFHDALDVAKGPSLGTNFTLGCAYTLFAHYDELEWAEEYGIVKHLVRISVGIENERFLDEVIKTALDAAERATLQVVVYVSSCVTLSLAYVRLIRDDPNDKHKFLAGSSLDISTRLELSIYVFPRGLNRSGGVTGYNPVAHNWKSIFGSTTTSYLTEY
ncbi:pyridoxal phosphate-dependent transferase [Fusarium oxysporum Fo47]|uniref:pyridoxal phosphate-dependent transferase n=1 Tax=Fusarium oxysporum Fo47 TaxID=660027 RepID=UPI002869CF99|nr:pyridoxal phosphate-dependent transferase [Fusarium oxysporum Fo47]QKD55652.2 pyridoxal phosphate-dependent transferase [Fusarium oxysporum Fo47]